MRHRSFGFAAMVAVLVVVFLSAVPAAFAQEDGMRPFTAQGKEFDRFDTGDGEARIVFLGHSSLALLYGGATIYIDPVKQYGDYASLPDADLILITHEHGDHLDAATIAALEADNTLLVLNESSRKKLGRGGALEHGETFMGAGVSVQAVPAYNVSAGRTNYHPRERRDNGYVLTVGSLRIYVAGDTEPIPEMAELGEIDIAFLPMNLPFTMTPEQVAQAARMIKPKILYPYHFGNTDPKALQALLGPADGMELRVRKLQ